MMYDSFLRSITSLNPDPSTNSALLDHLYNAVINRGRVNFYNRTDEVIFSESAIIIGLDNFRKIGKVGSYNFDSYESVYDFVINHIKNELGVSTIYSLGVSDLLRRKFQHSPIISTLGYEYNDLHYKIIFCLDIEHFNEASPCLGELFYGGYNTRPNINTYIYYDRILSVAMMGALFTTGTFEDLSSLDDFAKFRRQLKARLEEGRNFNYEVFDSYYTYCLRKSEERRATTSVSGGVCPPVRRSSADAHISEYIHNVVSRGISHNYSSPSDFDQSTVDMGTLFSRGSRLAEQPSEDGVRNRPVQSNPYTPNDSLPTQVFSDDEVEFYELDDDDDI